MDPATEALLGGNQPAAIIPASAVPGAASPAAQPISQTPSQAPAPTVGAVTTPGTPAQPAGAEPAKGGQAAPAVSDEQLLTAAGLTESSEKKLGRLERENTASGKEAKRLLEYARKLEGILEEQGADIAKDETGAPIGLLANKKYSKEAGALSIKVKDLPDDIQANFETDPQKVVDFIVDKAKKAMTRVVPTLDRVVSPLSIERHDAAMGYLADMKWETGDAKFPGLATNRKLIEQMLLAPGNSKALKEFYYQEPELALALLNLQLDHARLHIAEQVRKAAEDKEKAKLTAGATPQPIPTGGGVPGMGVSEEGSMAHQVAHARLQY